MTASRLLFRKLAALLSRKDVYFTRSLTYRQKEQALPPNFDYVRYATLGLCYEEIQRKQVVGAVAELGVYRGDFAVRLNTLFSDRKLYLFDTFTGFDAADLEADGKIKAPQDFTATTAAAVLSRMPHPEKCIIKEGRFPATAEGLEDRFCFVSIDADLYIPVLSGLQYFYPRLQPGGYIFIHDYHNDHYKGAMQAVNEFCAAEKITPVPLPDNGGTAVIVR